MFELRTTIDHTRHLCITLKSKLLIKTNKIKTTKTIVNELFQVSVDRRFKYRVKGIDESLSTDTTGVYPQTPQESIHRHQRVIINECRVQGAKEQRT